MRASLPAPWNWPAKRMALQDLASAGRRPVESDPGQLGESRYQLAIGTALQGDVQGAMDHLLHLVQHDPGFNDEAPRRKLLASVRHPW